MHRAAALPAGQEALGDTNVDKAADRLGGVKARQRSVLAGAPETENVPSGSRRSARVVEQQRDAVEAADRVFGRNVAGLLQAGLALRAGDANQREVHAVRIGERKHGLAEALLRRGVGDAVLDEAMGPVADRAFRDAKCRLLRLTDAAAARRGVLPRKERENGAGMAGPSP